jgi:hypothetical protein
MEREEMKITDLDKLMQKALAGNDELKIPSGLSNKTIRKLQRKILIRELFFELFVKLGIVLLSLSLLALVFVFFHGTIVIDKLYTFFATNRQIVSSLLLLTIVILFIDQIGLRLYQKLNKEVNWEL